MKVLKGTALLLQMAFFAVTGSIGKAKEAYVAFQALTKLNPLGLLIGAITAAIGLLVAFALRTKEATMRTEALADIQKKYNENIGDEISKVETLQKIIHNSNLSNQTRINAINELKKIIPGYNAELTAEGEIINENTTAVNNYIEALKRQAMAKAITDKLAELTKTKLDNEQKIEEIEIDPKKHLNWWYSIDYTISPSFQQERIKKVMINNLKTQNNEASKLQDELATSLAKNMTDASPLAKIDDAKYKNSKGYREAVDVATKTRNEAIEAAKNQKDPERFSIAPQPNPVTNAWGEAQNASKLPQRGPEFNISKEPELSISQKANIAIAETTFNNAIATINEKYKPKATGGEGGGGGTGAPDRFKAIDNWHEGEKAKASFDNNTIQLDDTKSPEAKLAAEKAYQEKLYDLELEYIEKKIKSGKLVGNEEIVLKAEQLELKKKHLEEEKNLEEKADADTRKKQQDELKKTFEDDSHNLKKQFANKDISETEYKHLLYKLEEAYQRDLADLYVEGTKERAEADLKIEKQKLDNFLKENQAYKDKIESIRKDVFGPTPEENKAAYNEKIKLLKEAYDIAITGANGNKEVLEDIEKKHNEEKLKLGEEYNQESSEGATKSYQETILASVDWLQNSDGGQALMGSVDFLAQASQAIFSQMSSIVQAEQDIQLAAVNNKYDQEIAAAEGNNYKIKQLEKQKSEEEAKIKKEGSKKMFAMQVIQAIATTAQAALNAYCSTAQIPLVGTILAPIAAGVAVVTGMLQVAAIKKQQQAAEAQGYFTGGFTRTGSNDYTPAGVVHANEWVANAHLLRSPIARPMIEALDYAQRTNTIGSLNSDRLASSGIVSPQVVIPAQPDAALAQSIATNTAVLGEYASVMSKLNDRLDKPFVTVNTVTGDHGIQKAQSEYDNMIKNKTPKSRWK